MMCSTCFSLMITENHSKEGFQCKEVQQLVAEKAKRREGNGVHWPSILEEGSGRAVRL